MDGTQFNEEFLTVSVDAQWPKFPHLIAATCAGQHSADMFRQACPRPSVTDHTTLTALECWAEPVAVVSEAAALVPACCDAAFDLRIAVTSFGSVRHILEQDATFMALSTSWRSPRYCRHACCTTVLVHHCGLSRPVMLLSRVSTPLPWHILYVVVRARTGAQRLFGGHLLGNGAEKHDLSP